MNKATYVKLKGKFTFAVNQSGLDFENKKERQEAIDDFWDLFNNFVEEAECNHFVTIEYDKKKLKVKQGE